VTRTEPARVLPPDLETFIQRGVSIMLGTRDSALVPELVRAWGPRVSRDRTRVSLCVASAVSARTLGNLQDNGRVAATFASPGDSTAIQMWGRCIQTGPASRQDLAAVEAHRDAFVELNKGLGVPRAFIEALWQRELAGSPQMMTIRFVAEHIFNQTPGPDAGSPL
jgi:hypothetical protein